MLRRLNNSMTKYSSKFILPKCLVGHDIHTKFYQVLASRASEYRIDMFMDVISLVPSPFKIARL